MTPLPVVLLAGGLGLRQRSDGDDLPKSLRALSDGRPLLLHVLDYYRAFGLREFVVCVGYRADAILERLIEHLASAPGPMDSGPGWVRLDRGDLRLTFVDSGVEAEKCARLLDARAHVGHRRFLLGYGDVLSNLDLHELVRVHERGQGRVTMAVTRTRSRYGRVAMGDGTLVTAFEEKPIEVDPISAGYFVCEPELFEDLVGKLRFEADVLARLAADRQLHAHVHRGLWIGLDTYKDFMDVATLVSQEGCAWLARR